MVNEDSLYDIMCSLIYSLGRLELIDSTKSWYIGRILSAAHRLRKNDEVK